MSHHSLYIQRCIDLAKKAKGKTYPNPMVGAVIVYNGVVIGEGYHKKAGQPHAEINAINSVKNPLLLKEATIYVSLEPCSHYGKTPPCAEKLAEIGFKKVVIGAIDNNNAVNGKGIKILENSGIEVITGILEKECKALNKRFYTFHEYKRPFVILKWAESNDGFIDKNHQPTAISNSISKQFVHTLRSCEQAILVGKNTALVDNPSLTVREITGNHPTRVLIDLNLDVPLNFNIYNSDAKVIVFNTIKSETQQHIQWVKIERANIVPNIMEALHTLNIQSIIIEGGANTLQQFIDANIWDEAIILRNPTLNLNSGTPAPVFDKKPIKTQPLRDNTVNFYKNHTF